MTAASPWRLKSAMGGCTHDTQTISHTHTYTRTHSHAHTHALTYPQVPHWKKHKLECQEAVVDRSESVAAPLREEGEGGVMQEKQAMDFDLLLVMV